ncbi:MAG: phospho-sugar mutase [Oscillospiraceae bacterium]|nr:phospho-sugar mutase [Oscillospiraceae bacterium]MBQ3803873.1 phospho-sugar mutase [Oscillospiraceae bacterium]MBQ6428236.1 phospho-sugar mutase [Oscillospiraceae bacterium]MBR2800179.1 phospho-sugar mutase [Oscillospiraceae bacterium]MBR2808067.1 phospho-sugar mutase [Oscillospiraceae bacterium]
MRNYMEEYQRWLDSPALSEEEWGELNAIREDEKEIRERFFAPLEFGTAGLRGTMKTGLHNMNIHIIRHATQAFADVICAEGEAAMKKGIVIAHDCRLNGRQFAEEAAAVMAANGIYVRIFDELRPTPELSFAVRYYGATAGLNVTASHNPKEYNGYKVYWSDGAQLPPQHADHIAQRMAETDLFTCYKTCDYKEAVKNGAIAVIGEETDEAFLGEVMKQAINPGAVAAVADEFRIVYTPFHGCGYKLVPEALKRLGMKHVFPVPEQMVIDGNFPTVVSPNPENPEGFYLAVALAKKVDSDLIIGTDPDSDRVGTMVRNADGEYVTITGNQMGVLLLDYIIQARKTAGSMPPSPGTMCSLVSTPMARTVAEKNGVHFEDTFTGFKFMAERVATWEAANSYQYIFAFEESYGYMVGDYVRDKDAVTISMLIAEMAAWYHAKGMTLLDALNALYEKYGWYMEKTLNLVMPGVDGLEKMRALMKDLRENPPQNIGGEEVIRLRDYLDGTINVMGLGKVDKTPYFGSNVLFFELADGSIFIVRPSGTEPKIKVYILVRGENREACDGKIERCVQFAEKLGK